MGDPDNNYVTFHGVSFQIMNALMCYTNANRSCSFCGVSGNTRRMASANRTPWRVLYLKQGDEMLLDFFIDDPDESFGFTK